MFCPKCNSENPADARFCGKCGTALKSVPPTMPASNSPDFSSTRAPRKRWGLTFTITFGAIAAVVVLVAGLGIIGMQTGKRPTMNAALPSPDAVANTQPIVPTPEEPPSSPKSDNYGNAKPPMNAMEVRPNFNEVSDSLYRQKAVGNWRVRRFLGNGAYMDMQAVYQPNGLATWGGTVTAQGQTVYISMTGSWEIQDGYFTIRITASNIPQLIRSGTTSVNRIVTLNDDELTCVDAQSGESETAIRVR